MTTKLFALLLACCWLLLACSAEEFVDLDDPAFDEEVESSQVDRAGPDDTASDAASDTASDTDRAEAGSEQAMADQFISGDCPFDAPTNLVLDCGRLLVPENRTKADSPTIELAVAILRAGDQSAEADPIVYLAGGPGGSALSDFSDDPESWTEYAFTRQRDLIFIDQRGTGYSSPSLNCPELESEAGGEGETELDCRDRLEAEGIDLTAYNTTENAADIAALIRALGYDHWNILGISYGTRLGLAVMRDHPQGIRSVVLDSPFPPNADTPGQEAGNTWSAFQALFADCAADPECDEAFPDLETVFLETVAWLNEDLEAEIIGDDLIGVIEQALTAGGDSAALVPLLIYDASEGYFELYEELLDQVGSGASRLQRQEVDRTDSEGMYFSVICRDEFAFGDYDRAAQAAEATIPPEVSEAMFGGTAGLFDTCDQWGAGAAPAVENAAVSSDIPTLILVGRYDPATPPSWGRLTAQTLSRGYYAEFPGAGHSLLSDVDCAIEMTNAFFANPNSEPDRSCLEQMQAPLFELP